VRWFFRVRENQAATATSGADRRDGFAGPKEGVDFGYAVTRCFATFPSSFITRVLGERAWSSDP
jgi:hypothetical protein